MGVTYKKHEKDDRVEYVIRHGVVVGTITRGASTALFRSKYGSSVLYPDASVARRAIERAFQRGDGTL